MTTIKDIENTIESMRKEFKIRFRFDQGGSGVTWKLNLDACGNDLVRSSSKAEFLRDVQTFRDGMRFIIDSEQEDESDYSGMGWIGKDGQP